MLPYFRSMEEFFNLTIPTGWQSLSDRQLLYFFRQLSRDLPMEEILTLCLFKWADLRVLCRTPNGSYLVMCRHALSAMTARRTSPFKSATSSTASNASTSPASPIARSPSTAPRPPLSALPRSTTTRPPTNTRWSQECSPRRKPLTVYHAPSSTPPTSSTTPSTAPSTNPLTHVIHPHFHIKKNTHIPRTHRLEALDAQRQDSVLHRCISLRYDFCKATRRMKLLDSNEIRQLRDV